MEKELFGKLQETHKMVEAGGSFDIGNDIETFITNSILPELQSTGLTAANGGMIWKAFGRDPIVHKILGEIQARLAARGIQTEEV